MARVWTTTNDGRLRLAADPAVTAGPGGTDSITVDARTSAQDVVGFGAAVTHSSAELLMGLPATHRRAVLQELFSPTGPVRLSVVRIPLGASDFTSGPAFTFDDVPSGATDWSLSSFSTAMDEAALRPVLREILAINPDVVVVASPWSAPAWLKTSRHLHGGSLRTDDTRAVPTYATYLQRALTEYRAAGVPISVLTLQNEPQTRTWGDYPRMEMPAAQQVQLLEAVSTRLRTAGLGTQVLAFDHNWQQHPADRQAVPAGGDPEDDYAARVLSSPAGALAAGTAFHCYYGDASAQEAHRARFPRHSIWVTECSGSHAPGDAPDKVFADTLYWQSKNLLVAPLRHWASTLITWNLALDASGGPHRGGCETCTGVVTVQDGVVTRNAEFYVLAHAARFVPRGSLRVASTASVGTLDQVAFRAPDGTVTVVVHSTGWQDRTVRVTVDGVSYPVSVKAWSTASITVGPSS